MPYRSKKKRRLYAQKWRKKHPKYAKTYSREYYHDLPRTGLLGRKLSASDGAPTPVQSGAEIEAGLVLPT